jgi:hypothetical protein
LHDVRLHTLRKTRLLPAVPLSRSQASPRSDLPANWAELTVGALWDRLNDQHRRSTPEVTIEAIMTAVHMRGLAALKEPANVERLARCDEAAKAEIARRIRKLSGR